MSVLNQPSAPLGPRIRALVTCFESEAWWRREKAEEYPDDKRNQRSADALEELARFVAQLPEDDPRLDVLDQANVFTTDEVDGETSAVRALLASLDEDGDQLTRIMAEANLARMLAALLALCNQLGTRAHGDRAAYRTWLSGMSVALDVEQVGRDVTEPES